MAVTAFYGAASLGFSVWNWPSTKSFIGDAKSGFLGFSFRALAVASFAEAGFAFWAWLLLLRTFLSDTSVTLVRHVFRAERFYEAHRSHAYQHAARRDGGHLPITLAVGHQPTVVVDPRLCLGSVAEWGVALLAIAWIPLIALALRLRADLPG